MSGFALQRAHSAEWVSEGSGWKVLLLPRSQSVQLQGSWVCTLRSQNISSFKMPGKEGLEEFKPSLANIVVSLCLSVAGIIAVLVGNDLEHSGWPSLPGPSIALQPS